MGDCTRAVTRDLSGLGLDGATIGKLCRATICLSVDITGRLLCASAAGREFVTAGGLFRLEAGRIVATTAAATASLRSAIRQAGIDGAAVPLTLPREDAAEYPVLVSPPGEVACCAGPEAQAVVQTLPPDYRRAGPSAAQVAAWFGLTPAESEVALRAARGDGLRAIADALGIQHSTARSHLHRVFQKAGVSRQAELAWLVAHLPR